MLIPFEQAWLPQLVTLWNAALPRDKVTAERLQPLFEDANFDPGLLLLDEQAGVLRGFALGMHRKVPYFGRGLEADTGWILAFGTAPGQRRAGVATALLCELETRLARLGAKHIVLGAYSPFYFMPGLDSEGYPEAEHLLAARGYATGDVHIAMYRTLFQYTVPAVYQKKQEAAQARGYQFVRHTPERTAELLAFMGRWFTPGWLYNAQGLAATQACAEQTWLCLCPKGEIVGFAQRGMGGIACRFGPFGIRPDHRDQALGSILLCCMLYDMSCRGLYLAHFMSTDKAGARMYARHGFKPYRTFVGKTLHLTP